jgi:alcohol dehydrogenase class IV
VTRFTWRDAERVVEFGPDVAERVPDLLARHGWDGYQVLTTARADPGLGSALYVGPGQVPELAAELLPQIESDRLVAWGGGRVIDVAKAIASARGAAVCAVPTTLSGAEMSSGHRRAAGHERSPAVRPALVLADPDLMTGMPQPELAWSAMNAMAHAMESLVTPLANPVTTMAGLRAARLLCGDDLALGSLLAGYALGASGFALHHVVCQTVVRECGTAHACTNAALLPHTTAALMLRAPGPMREFGAELGVPLTGIVERLEQLGRGARVEVDATRHEQLAEVALQRAELAATPGPPVTRGELLGILAVTAPG